MRDEIHFYRIKQMQERDGGNFSRHAEVAPEIGTVREGFVVDFNDAVRPAPGDRRAHLTFQFDDPSAVAVDAQLDRKSVV